MKRKKIMLSLSILCIILLLGVAIWFIKLKNSPKQKIIMALTDTCSSMTLVAGTSSDQLIGMDKINTILSEQSAQLSGDFTIDFVNKLVEYDALEGFSFAFEGKRDLSNQEASFSLSLGEKNPLTLSTYLSNEALVLSVPKLSDTNYHINFFKINESLKDSFLGEYLDLPEVTIQPLGTPNHPSFSKVFSSFLRNRTDDWTELFAEMTLEKQDKKTVTTLEGTKKCTSYEITLPKESLENFLDNFQDYIHSNSAKELDLSEEAYEKLKEDMERFQNLVTNHLEDDLVFHVSLDKKGTLREFIAFYEELSFHATFMGTKQNTDAISAQLDVQHETYPVTMIYEESTTKENDMDLLERNITIFFTKEPEKNIKITTENAFSPETLEFENVVKFVIPTVGINAELSYEGRFADYVKNQSFSADINKLNIKVFGIRIVSLQGELAVSPLKDAITPEDPETDIFTITKEKQEELVEQIKKMLQELKNPS